MREGDSARHGQGGAEGGAGIAEYATSVLSGAAHRIVGSDDDESDGDFLSTDDLEHDLAPPVYKIEVASARSIRALIKSFGLLATFICLTVFVEEVIKYFVVRTEFVVYGEGGSQRTITFSDFSRAENIVVAIVQTLVFVFTLCVLLVYSIRLGRLGWASVHEAQILTWLMLVFVVLQGIPIVEWQTTNDTNVVQVLGFLTESLDSLTSVSVSSAVFEVAGVFYVWSMLDFYRGWSKRRLAYGKKAAVCLVLLSVKVFFAGYGFIGFHPFPLVSVIPTIGAALSGNLSEWQITMCSINFVFQLGVLLWLMTVAYTTKYKLDRVDYAKNRPVQLAFRFFIFSCATTYTFGLLLALFNETIRTTGFRDLAVRILGVLPLTSTGNVFDETAIVLVFMVAQVYASLPADTDRFPFWYRAVRKDMVPRAVKFRMHALPAEISLKQTKLFVADTCVLMFNFSAWTYRYNKPGERPDVLSEYTETSFKDERTDTHVLVHHSPERIIVSFRGTKGTKNWKTDLQTKRISWKKHRELLGVEYYSDSHSRFEKAVTVHAGFSHALKTVYSQVVEHLRSVDSDQSRPIFLCGHSLGGALAVLTAVNCITDYPELRDRIAVYTFGSPKVGNAAWVLLCSHKVRDVWRIAMSGDIITKMPTWPYSHCGTEVLLTEIGELFLDPTPLENVAFNRRRSKLARHHNGTYGAALRRWGRARGYVPPIWECYEERMNMWEKEFVPIEPSSTVP